ncbi:cysteine-rich venom protein [Octopus bimaculoides]|uniref:SCP domain-containing protein n=1 Tax=Octopus bimaculoides TaxID=37653 RepID=A0A0L8G3R1_OCTBM|nr:cysteine-rich venom protein [Octopus bimaculoides]|eukprot:XP_014784375.1 PREDICTED: cysteine-rich venom protein-like [Octopus bimaculoides]
MFQLLQFFVLFQIFCFAYGGQLPVNCTEYPQATMCLTDVSHEPIIPTEDDVQNILYLHNQYREQVEPLAKKMIEMVWSESMAELALKWAMQCRFDHDTNTARIIRGYAGVGQNVLGATFKASWNKTVTSWHSEIKDYTFGVNTQAMVGHYTQEIYWDAKLIGCGGAYCPNTSLPYIFVCDYFAGQKNTQFPYQLASASHKLTNCRRPENSTLCDCNGKACQFGGALNINTCKCNCFQVAKGAQCENQTCDKADATFCEYYPTTFCQIVYNYGFSKYCPHRCGMCPI